MKSLEIFDVNAPNIHFVNLSLGAADLLGLGWILKQISQGLMIPCSWVNIKLADSCIGELFGRPPRILNRL